MVVVVVVGYKFASGKKTKDNERKDSRLVDI